MVKKSANLSDIDEKVMFSVKKHSLKFYMLAGGMSMVNYQLSKRIISLRFLLIVFIVFIHNNVTEIKFSNVTEVYQIPGYVGIIRTLISNIVARSAVPLFFLISGYLLYLKETSFLTVLKKKNESILTPYILWNVLTVLFYFTAQSFSFTNIYFVSPQNIIRNFGLMDWIDVFCGKFTERAPFPFVYQFWFLRDLFILNLLFKVIKILIDKSPLGILVLLLTLWTLSINIYLVSPEALLFFSFGYYVIKYSLSIDSIDNINILSVSICYLLAIIYELFFTNHVFIAHKINIILGCIFFLKLSYHFVKKEKLYNFLDWLGMYAFFIYAFHEPLLTILNKLIVRIIPMYGGFILAQYFTIVILGVLISILSGVILKKTLPKTYAVLTGGRV